MFGRGFSVMTGLYLSLKLQCSRQTESQQVGEYVICSFSHEASNGRNNLCAHLLGGDIDQDENHVIKTTKRCMSDINCPLTAYRYEDF